MTVEPLEQLRAADPVPDGSSAPPVEWVLARIEGVQARPGRHRRSWGGAFMPAIAVAATLIVVAVVLIAVTHRHRPAPAHIPPATQTTPAAPSLALPATLMPRGGMHGLLFITAAASPSASSALISFGQCQPCHKGGAGRGSATHDWTATTTDGGTTWHVVRASATLDTFAFGGADGWAEGLRSDGHGAGGVAAFFASHDGGRSWHVASSADPAPGGVGDVSIAGGEVWSLGSGCTGTGPCTDTTLHAPAASDHLTVTAGQPPLGDTTNVDVVATARDDAYVLTDDYSKPTAATFTGTRLFGTHDGGRTWRRLASPCAGHGFGRLYAGGADALWATCQPRRGPLELWRSTDGGEHWTALPARLGDVTLEPASGQVAWALAPGGRVLRTSDGGRTWTTAWYGGRPEAERLAGNTPVLTVQSPTTATVIAVVTRGRVDGHAKRTDFVAYRTTDGGHTWRPSVVLLPPA